MHPFYTALIVIGATVLFLAAAALLTAYICFYQVFYATSRQKRGKEEEHREGRKIKANAAHACRRVRMHPPRIPGDIHRPEHGCHPNGKRHTEGGNKECKHRRHRPILPKIDPYLQYLPP